MTTRLIAILAAAAGSLAVAAQDDPLASLLASERAFARMSVEKGRVAAFLANFADEGIGFQPAPVKMKELLGRAPAASGPAPVLDWEPWTGDVAASGDLGYTTGPWERRPVDPAGQVLHGWFFSVWKRTGGGPWRVVADIGISSPPAGPLRPHPFERVPGSPRSYEDRDAVKTLLGEEQALSREAGAGPAADAYRGHSADHVRLYRDAMAPIVGRDQVSAHIADQAARISSEAIHADVSLAGDLGYAYGSYRAVRADGQQAGGYYLRVWTRRTDGWRIAGEVTNADKQ